MIPSPLLQPPHKTSWKYTLFNRLIWNHLMNTFSVIFDTATLCFVWFCAEFRSFLFIWEKKENTSRADITFQYRWLVVNTFFSIFFSTLFFPKIQHALFSKTYLDLSISQYRLHWGPGSSHMRVFFFSRLYRLFLFRLNVNMLGC